MLLKLIQYGSFLLIGWIFGTTLYNHDLKNLAEEFTSKENFIEHQNKLSSNNLFEEDINQHLLNQVSFRLNNISITDTNNLTIIDSLLNKILLDDSLSNSIHQNQDSYYSFVSSFDSHLLTQTGFLNDEKLDIIKDIYLDLETALRFNPNNNIARHNYIILKTLHQSKDFNYQKAKQLSDLVFNQLKRDLLSDTLRQKQFANETIFKGLEQKTETIKNINLKNKCVDEINDTINSLIDSTLLVDYQKQAIDSMRQYSTVDQEFVESLEAGKTRNEIINDFYSKNYQELYGNTSVAQIKKLIKDEPLNKSISEVLCKYLEEGCGQDSQDNKDEKSEEKQDEEQDQQEEQKQDQQDQEKQKDQNSEGSEGDSKKQQGDNSDQEMEDFKNSKPENKESQNQNSKEMSDQLDDYEKQRQQKEAQQDQNSEQSKDQDEQNGKSGEQQNTASKEKLDKYNITPEQAEEALRKMQEQNEKHYKSQKKIGNEQNDSENKPSW